MYVCVYVCICMYVLCMYVLCMYVCMYVYMYVYVRVCMLVGVLIKWLYEMHGATIKLKILIYVWHGDAVILWNVIII